MADQHRRWQRQQHQHHQPFLRKIHYFSEKFIELMCTQQNSAINTHTPARNQKECCLCKKKINTFFFQQNDPSLFSHGFRPAFASFFFEVVKHVFFYFFVIFVWLNEKFLHKKPYARDDFVVRDIKHKRRQTARTQRQFKKSTTGLPYVENAPVNQMSTICQHNLFSSFWV